MNSSKGKIDSDPMRIEELLSQVVAEVQGLREAMEHHNSLEQPLTRKEAARYLRMHPDTLYRLARQNRITYSRMGEGQKAPMLFRKGDLDEYLSRQRILAVE